VFKVGEKLRSIRRHKRLSLREVAEKAEVSISHLSQVESGKTNPSVSSLTRIATALSVPFDCLFTEETAVEIEMRFNQHNGTINEQEMTTQATDQNTLQLSHREHLHRSSTNIIVHPGTRETIQLMGGVTWARLTSESENGIEFREICYEVGADSGPVKLHHPGREFGIILKGSARLEVDQEHYMLQEGDSFSFDSMTPHRLINTGQETMSAIWVTFTRL
jgi:transcriptional regulator with XRE-family HTH domain